MFIVLKVSIKESLVQWTTKLNAFVTEISDTLQGNRVAHLK